MFSGGHFTFQEEKEGVSNSERLPRVGHFLTCDFQARLRAALQRIIHLRGEPWSQRALRHWLKFTEELCSVKPVSHPLPCLHSTAAA